MLHCQLTSNLLNYPNVERFLQDFKPDISMNKDEKLKEKVQAINNNIDYDYFCDSIKLLIRFYKKMVVTMIDPSLPLFITKFKETTRTKVQEAVKMYTFSKQKQSTALKQPETDPCTNCMQILPIEASPKRNNLSSNDNVNMMMNKLLNNNNKDLDWIQWSPSILTNSNSCSALFTLDSNPNRDVSRKNTTNYRTIYGSKKDSNTNGNNASITTKVPKVDYNDDDKDNNSTSTSITITGTKTGVETNSRKRKTMHNSKTKNDDKDDNSTSSIINNTKNGDEPKPKDTKKKLEKKTKKTTPNTKNNSARRSSPRKTVHLDPKFERITSITQQQDLDLKQAFATLFNSYENKQVVECFTTQKEILELCLRLKDAIQNNFDKETNPPKGTREGFNVTYSKAMGYHSKTGKLNGFTIKSVSHGKNLYIHDFNDEKRNKKLSLWEKDIWTTGLKILHLTGYNEGKSDNVCMQFGFMLPGDYVVKVRFIIFMSIFVRFQVMNMLLFVMFFFFVLKLFILFLICWIKHQDLSDVDAQCAITMGKYVGGELLCWNEKGDKRFTINTPNNPTIMDGRLPHMVKKVTGGKRYHLVVYKHYEPTPVNNEQFPIYDVAEFHPDSQSINVLSRDGYWVHSLPRLDLLHQLTIDFLFEKKTKCLKEQFKDMFKLIYLYKDSSKEAGVDPNCYIMKNIKLPDEIVTTVAVAMSDVCDSIKRSLNTNNHPQFYNFGLMLKAPKCRKQPMHINGELDSYHGIIPILSNVNDSYELYAVKVCDFC